MKNNIRVFCYILKIENSRCDALVWDVNGIGKIAGAVFLQRADINQDAAAVHSCIRYEDQLTVFIVLSGTLGFFHGSQKSL